MLNPVDRWFFAMDAPETPSHVAVMATYEIPEGAPEDFVARLAERMRAVRRFPSPFNYRLSHASVRRIAPSLTELDDSEVDIDYHFRVSALPHPAGERELGVLVSHLHSQPLDPHRPLWEVHLIEGLESNRFAWYFKVHHGLMDGMGGMRRFGQMMARDPDSEELRPIWSIPARSRSRPDGPGPSLARRAAGLVGQASAAATNAGALALATGQMVRERLLPTDDAFAVPYAAPMSILNGRVGQQRRFATQTYDLDRILALKSGFDVTVNDVFLALCSGALRKYLGELGTLPDSSLTVGIPVSVREEGDEQSSNAISAVLVRLRTDIADPAERIRAIGESSRLAKGNLQSLPRGAGEMFGAVALSPLMVSQFTGLAGRTPPVFNLLVSQVPGPAEPLYMGGARMEALYPLSIVSHGQALNISADSMSGRFNVGILGCRDALPSLQRLAVFMGEALAELEEALAAAKRVSKRKSSAATQ